MQQRKITFEQNEQTEFWSSLKARVNAYFTDNNISPYANHAMIFKIVVMLLLFILPYALLYSGWLTPGQMWLLCIVMGFGMAGIGLSISHQAAHNAIFESAKANRLLSLTFNLVGMSDYIWKIKHNVYHHAYTNVYEMDEALKEGDLLRMSADAPLKPIHRYQHLYGFFVYALFTIFWAFALDFEKLNRYNGYGSRNPEVKHPVKEVTLFYATKIYYILIAFVLPLMLLDLSVWQVAGGFVTVHVVASLIVTHVLQVEHLVEETVLVSPDESGKINKSWAMNQVEGTCNFDARSSLFEWYIGGSNYQVEHHLFPGFCSVHYPALSKIVEQTANEFGINYRKHRSFQSAVVSHYRLLKKLGAPAQTELSLAK
jgi:linoleoyl-CoA desaturase